MQPKLLVREDLEAGRLVSILPDLIPKPRPVRILYSRDRRTVPKVRTFVDLLVARAGKLAVREGRGDSAA